MRISLDNIDLEERDANFKPIFKAKDVLADIASIGDMAKKLKELEVSYMKEQMNDNVRTRGDVTPGFMD
jgi:hypothetical protein